MDKYNIALYKLIEKCNKYNCIILLVNYSRNIGVIEIENGTPVTIYYYEETNEWR